MQNIIPNLISDVIKDSFSRRKIWKMYQNASTCASKNIACQTSFYDSLVELNKVVKAKTGYNAGWILARPKIAEKLLSYIRLPNEVSCIGLNWIGEFKGNELNGCLLFSCEWLDENVAMMGCTDRFLVDPQEEYIGIARMTFQKFEGDENYGLSYC